MLNRVLDERLWQTVRGEEVGPFLRVHDMARFNFEVALNGPISQEEYSQ